jgi:hypothetical protein
MSASLSVFFSKEKRTDMVKLDGSKGEAQLKVWHKSAWAVVHRPTHQRRLS